MLAKDDPFGSRGQGEFTFNLREAKLISPAALVQLVAACYCLSMEGRPANIVVEDVGVRYYLKRSGFADAVARVASITPSIEYSYSGHLRGSNYLLIEVTKIESGAALPDILSRLIWVLRKRLKYRKFDALDIATVVSEVCQNTFDHNHQTCGFIAMQVYKKDTPEEFVEIGIADYGDGLAATLSRNKKNLPILSGTDAVLKATQLRVSAYDDPTRGTGLHHLLEITYKHDGSVQIRSGRGAVRFRWDKKQGWRLDVPNMPGVQVTLTFPSKKRA